MKKTTCRCPKCGRIFESDLFIFDHNSNQLFKKYCNICLNDIKVNESLTKQHHNSSNNNTKQGN